MDHFILLFLSLSAGFLGSMLGLGGGVIIVPTLTLIFNIDIKYAIATSLVAIVATSSGAAASFLRDHFTNVRVAILLEVGTVAGALSGFLLSSFIGSRWLFLLFGGFLLLSGVLMLLKKDHNYEADNHPWSEKLELNSHYLNDHQELIPYNVSQVPFGIICMYFAGALSALLGIGSGSLKVLAMDHAMKLPLKVSSATSNFMIGVTASASAGAYFFQGYVIPEITAPVVLGVLVGSYFGSKTLKKISTKHLRKVFIMVILFISFQVIRKGL